MTSDRRLDIFLYLLALINLSTTATGERLVPASGLVYV
jgi:hypothetical protein